MPKDPADEVLSQGSSRFRVAILNLRGSQAANRFDAFDGLGRHIHAELRVRKQDKSPQGETPEM